MGFVAPPKKMFPSLCWKLVMVSGHVFWSSFSWNKLPNTSNSNLRFPNLGCELMNVFFIYHLDPIWFTIDIATLLVIFQRYSFPWISPVYPFSVEGPELEPPTVVQVHPRARGLGRLGRSLTLPYDATPKNEENGKGVRIRPENSCEFIVVHFFMMY